MSFIENHPERKNRSLDWIDGYVHCMNYYELEEILPLRFSSGDILRICRNCFTMDKIAKILDGVKSTTYVVQFVDNPEEGLFQRLTKRVEDIKDVVADKKVQGDLIHITEMDVSSFDKILSALKRLAKVLTNTNDYQTKFFIITDLIRFKLDDFCVMHVSGIGIADRFLLYDTWGDFIEALYREDYDLARKQMNIFVSMLSIPHEDAQFLWSAIIKSIGQSMELFTEPISKPGTELVPMEINGLPVEIIKLVEKYFWKFTLSNFQHALNQTSLNIAATQFTNKGICRAIDLCNGNIERIVSPAYLDSIVIGLLEDTVCVMYEGYVERTDCIIAIQLGKASELNRTLRNQEYVLVIIPMDGEKYKYRFDFNCMDE